MSSHMDWILKAVADAFDYDINDVREAYIKSEEKTIDEVLAYCKEKADGKEN
jgi:hypothetical protein